MGIFWSIVSGFNIRWRILLFASFVMITFSASGQKSGVLDLSGNWKVTWNEGGHGPQSLDAFLRSNPVNDPARYLEVEVPEELHHSLQKKGFVEDINYGMNSLKARWVAEKYWQYVKIFNAPEASLNSEAWLVMDQLDLNARIFLNGVEIGEHHSVFFPCRINVTGKLKAGENLLQIGLESGLYGVAEKEGEAYLQNMGALLNKRHWQRKPQYQFLWDWNPQLINVGITGNVRLEWAELLRMDQLVIYPLLNENLSRATLKVKALIEGIQPGEEISLKTVVRETGEFSAKSFVLKEGTGNYETEVELVNPRLWWPAGQGEQALYHIDLEVSAKGKTLARETRRTGIRKIEIDQSVHPVAGNYFTILVNHRKVFMKGGNWVPPDMIYSNIPAERMKSLVNMAVDANFNMLRIWGGAIWAGHPLLDLCDEKGLLVWHDLLFACSKYPGDNKEFYELVKKEVSWGVREYSAHPSLAVWCGNNENEVGTWYWGWEKFGKIMPDYGLYHLEFPRIIKSEDPSRPYWPSSPYSPGIENPNSPIMGDQHPWNVMLGSAGPDFWEYRSYVDRFPNEGGVLGASSPATLMQFLPPGEQYLRSFSWDHHDNEVNFWNDRPGINYQMTGFWLGKKATEMSLENYALASGLLQAEGLMEYITNYRRRMFSSSSAIFWMYNDSWPATHGWTIVDYYLRKKLAYYPVKRAFEPVTVVVAMENDSVKIFGVNDGPTDWSGQVRYGICQLAGGFILDQQKDVVLPQNKSVALASFPGSLWKKSDTRASASFGCLLKNNRVIAQHRLFIERFKDLSWQAPQIKITRSAEGITLQSPVFVWGACVDVNGEKEIPDNCFDLLPGIPYTIPWASKEMPKILFTGNDLQIGGKR